MKTLFGILLLSLSSLSMASDNGYLFFQTAAKAELIKNKGNQYTLTLTDVTDHISYFTNRPARQAGYIPLSRFTTLWNNKNIPNNFAKVPPNAAITMMQKNGHQQNLVAIISNPVVLGKSVSYTLNIISHKALKTGKMNHIDLFFDDIHWNPDGF